MNAQGKSSVEEIRERFDHDVERFSNLETGQSATVDAVLSLEVITQAATACTPEATSLLDLGCGAGNFTLRLLQQGASLEEISLVDLSLPMLQRASQRISLAYEIVPTTVQTDLRSFHFEENRYDIVLAGAVLHHLRGDDQWQEIFEKIYRSLRPGGSFWIFDLLRYNHPETQRMMWNRYGQYLTNLRDEVYRDQVFAYIEKEDTPRSLCEQLQLLERVGFADVDVLHCKTCFAAFGGVRK